MSSPLALLDTLKAEFLAALGTAEAAQDQAELQRLRSAFFGPKGHVTLLLRSVGQLPAEERPGAGKLINQVRQDLESKLSGVIEAHEARAKKAALSSHRVDTTLPGRQLVPFGAVHPVHRVIARMTELFVRMGFEVVTGPEVELDELNFGALNFPDDHPARDMQDTFFVRPPDERSFGRLLLRTHTSPVQVRQMRAEGAPIRIIAPGRVYRCDSDASHSPMFHQIEGLWVEEGVSFAHLKGVLTSFIHSFFGERGVRFRPSFFPFVEPGAEVDIGCVFCGGAGCRVCKHTGWMEILGAGMVHPNVLEACGIDSERHTGFAFGVGVDRIAMQLYGIDDLKHLFASDMRFLEAL